MKKIKFLHCADVHLDMPFTSLGIENKNSSVRRADLKETFQRIIDTARQEEVDMVFICGDLYEHEYVRKSTIDFINYAFSSIQDIKIFIIPGNHDPLVNGSYYTNYEWAKNVNILSRDNPYVHLKEGINIYGGCEPFEKASIQRMVKDNSSDINILLVHGTADLDISSKDYNPVSSEELAGLGMDYVAMGHFHRRIDNIGGKGVIYNPGSPEPLGFDEPGKHGAYIGTFYSGKLDIEFKVLNKRNYEEIKVNVTNCYLDEQIISNITGKLDLLPFTDLSLLLLNIVFVGYIDPDYRIDLEYISAALKDRFFYVKLEDNTIPEYDFDSIKNEPGLKGLFTKKILSLMDKTQDSKEKELLVKSLYYGIQALEKGQVDVI